MERKSDLTRLDYQPPTARQRLRATLQGLSGLIAGTTFAIAFWKLALPTLSRDSLLYAVALFVVMKLVVSWALQRRRAWAAFGIGVLLSIGTGLFVLLIFMAEAGFRNAK
jgi:hypothetical protein